MPEPASYNGARTRPTPIPEETSIDIAPRTVPHRSPWRSWLAVLFAAALGPPWALARDEPPIFDAHVHYSHDAWDRVPAERVIELMRAAGLKRALVSSSSDDGTQKLLAAAPDLIVPSLRPYRRRGELSTWLHDDSVIAHIEDRLRRFRYVAIGEFHVYGADADLPVMRRTVELAREHGLLLHLHGDADAVARVFAQDPEAGILWAHAGFEPPATVGDMLRRHRRLWADLAFRTDHASAGKVSAEWRALFVEFPERFMLGTDTFTPERLHYIPEHARWSREWLADLPPDLAEQIAWRNGEALLGRLWQQR